LTGIDICLNFWYPYTKKQGSAMNTPPWVAAVDKSVELPSCKKA